MKKKILALDMGGTSVKAALYHGGVVEKETRWEHDYKDCGLNKAKEHLVNNIKAFCDCKIDAIGLSVAGLVATDNSLYRSTVVTSFQGLNIPEFLKQEFDVDVATMDNDADCGAISEFQEGRGRFFYVVVGSGIGSAYVDHDGNLPYLTRFEPKHNFSDNNNPIPNDLGLQVAVPRGNIYKKFGDYYVERTTIDKVLTDKDGKPLKGPNDDAGSIRVGRLGSATGLKNIIDMLLSGKDLVEYYQNKAGSYILQGEKVNFGDLSNEKRIAKTLSIFARNGESYAKTAFKLFGHFLGYGIAEAVEIICSDQKIHGSLRVRLSGPIMASYDLFKMEIIPDNPELEADYPIELAKSISGSNTHGAYLRALKALNQNK